MPVQTRLTNPEGEVIPIRWGWWHVQVLGEAMQEEDPTEKLFPKEGVYTFTREWIFVDEEDGEVFPIHIGTKYEAWR